MKKLSLVLMAAFCAPLVVSHRPTFAHAPACVEALLTPQVAFFLLVNGTPIEITEDASWNDGHVYLLSSGVCLGTVTSNGLIIGTDGQVVGLVCVMEGGMS